MRLHRSFPMRHAAIAWACALLPLAATAQMTNRAPAPEGCGETRNLYGPFDYRTAAPSSRYIVEIAHFTKGVETLTKGATGPFGGDIGYTLAVFPNHARAIITLERLVERTKRDPAEGSDMTLECYFGRGMNFAPDDHVFRMLYVNYLIRKQRLDEAQRFLAYVVERATDNPLTQFNAGMLYFDMKDYDKALVQAHRAVAMDMTRVELRQQLTAVGRWKDPEPAAPDAAASAASATAASAASAPASDAQVPR
jgi:predicted Zn-dependent protease